MHLDISSHGHVRRKIIKAYLNQLLGIERPVIVGSLGYVFVHQDSSSVECLPDAVSIGSALDLLNEYWGKTLASQLLSHTQEVDLDHADLMALGLD